MSNVKFIDCTEFGATATIWSQLDPSIIFGVAADANDEIKRNESVSLMLRYRSELPNDVKHISWAKISDNIYFTTVPKWQAWEIALKYPNYVKLAK